MLGSGQKGWKVFECELSLHLILCRVWSCDLGSKLCLNWFKYSPTYNLRSLKKIRSETVPPSENFSLAHDYWKTRREVGKGWGISRAFWTPFYWVYLWKKKCNSALLFKNLWRLFNISWFLKEIHNRWDFTILMNTWCRIRTSVRLIMNSFNDWKKNSKLNTFFNSNFWLYEI